MNLRTLHTVDERRLALEKERNISIPSIGNHVFEGTNASERNCENMIGAIQVPLGIAGPLKVNTKYEIPNTRYYYVPLATTEGALVASVNRGCKAITLSGGATVKVKRVGVTRGPVFSVETEEEKKRLAAYLKQNTEKIKEIAEATSKHLKYLKYDIQFEHPYAFVRFFFDTGEAMGMNMVTIATHAIADHLKDTLGIRCIAVSGNFCVDKKPNFHNFQHGRGRWVTATATVPEAILQTVLKTTAQKLYEVWHAKCVVGSRITGIIGGNAQIANIVAALFIATGQDVAHVTEGSMATTTTEYTSGREGIRISVDLPDVMVGTVGGGTGLPTQRESLEILGLTGGENGENADTLAGIVGAAALAGELSLLSSLSEGSLGCAHERLGRGKHTTK